jgi:anti-sigma regulatory factor (Ser/Thr protein kinase)
MSRGVAGDSPAAFSTSLEVGEPAVEAGRQALLAYLAPFSLGPAQLNRIEVVLEELISNVVRHGEFATGLSLSGACANGTVTIVVEDDGIAFNPLGQAEPARFATLAQAGLGGLGIPLIKRLADRVDYARVGARNRTTVVIGQR